MSVDNAVTTGCDTPECEGAVEEITPEGYVCETCADEIARIYREAEQRDTEAWRGGR